VYLIRLTAALLTFVLLAVLNLIETRAGLPNTCSKCGQPIAGAWFAPNIDAARSGQGQCYQCAGQPRPEDTDESVSPQAVNVTADVAELQRQLEAAQAQIAILQATNDQKGEASDADHDKPGDTNRPGPRRSRG
jgi:hypothetical protein